MNLPLTSPAVPSLIPCWMSAQQKKQKDTILLDRCILEDKTKEIDDRNKEEAARLQVEFQLERSILRKKHREVG